VSARGQSILPYMQLFRCARDLRTDSSIDWHRSALVTGPPPRLHPVTMPASNIATPSAVRPVVIPFLSSRVVDDLWLFIVLWPLWWLLGVEQLIVPFFVFFLAVRLMIARGPEMPADPLVLIAFLLALVWVLPGMAGLAGLPLAARIEPEMIGVFMKEGGAIWSQAALLYVFFAAVRTEADRERVMSALDLICVFVAVGALLYLSGALRGEFSSGLGLVLPREVVERSAFFSSVGRRSFGVLDESGLPRLTSVALSYSGLSLLTVLLLPYVIWRTLHVHGIRRAALVLATTGLLACWVFAQSRVAYGALLGGICVGLVLGTGLHRRQARFVAMGAVAAITLLVTIILVVAGPAIAAWLQRTLLQFRPGSAFVRLRIYYETIQALPEHWIMGWGTSVRIPGMSTTFAMGTHSSYLGILFQHGAVGLGLYIGLLAILWRRIIRGLSAAARRSKSRGFWLAAAMGIAAFNLREVADLWMWDQLVTMSTWCLWGLVLSKARSATARMSAIDLA
jgi:hypothetical protein